MSVITWDSKHFYVDGRIEKFVSGSIHYFRVHPEYWKDRLLKLRECGCNCVETYVAWNYHEKVKGVLDFSEWLDLGKYLETVKELGLYAIVRPGPYICSECDFGGLPWWLLQTPDISVRCSDERYLDACTPYLERVCEIIKPYLISNGGPVAFVQVENEYGSVGNDKAYLEWLRDFYISHGIDCPLLTSDGGFSLLLKNGTVDGVLASVNYQYDPEYIKPLNVLRPDQPSAVMELWTGRQDRWNKNNPPRDIEQVKKSVEDAIDKAELVNMYMFHGGTTFGFMNGMHIADGELSVLPNNYDVDAPLDEFGRRTPKYYAEQKIICEKLGLEIKNTATDTEIRKYADAVCTGVTSLSESGLDIPAKDSVDIKPMEAYGQGYGCIVYETEVLTDGIRYTLALPKVHDIAHVYIDGKYVKTFLRSGENELELPIADKCRISILVESMGRMHCSARIGDRKGLVGKMFMKNPDLLDFSPFGYKVYNLTLDKLPNEYNGHTEVNTPAFYRYEFVADEVCDTVVNFEGFTRGFAYVNGFNLGRHWDTVYKRNRAYIPAPFIKKGVNEIVIFDVLHRDDLKRVSFGEKD